MPDDNELHAKLNNVDEEWRSRIRCDVTKLFAAVVNLRKAAQTIGDDELAYRVGELHEAVCHTANTVTIKFLLNGYRESLMSDAIEDSCGREAGTRQD